MALVKGICKNFGECDLADSKEIQEAEKSNFVCEECGKPLHPIDDCGGKKVTPGKNKKLIAGAAAAIIILGGGIAALMLGGGDEKGPVATTPPDTMVVQKVDTPAVETLKPEEATKEQETTPAPTKVEPKPEPPKTQQPTSYNLGWGRYEGPMSGGKPNGFGGTITVSSYYSIDLKKASGETVEVNSGDKIMNVKMDNGRLRQGEIHFADGTRRFISGL